MRERFGNTACFPLFQNVVTKRQESKLANGSCRLPYTINRLTALPVHIKRSVIMGQSNRNHVMKTVTHTCVATLLSDPIYVGL